MIDAPGLERHDLRPDRCRCGQGPVRDPAGKPLQRRHPLPGLATPPQPDRQARPVASIPVTSIPLRPFSLHLPAVA